MKITEIKIEKMTTRERVDEFGKRVRYQEPIMVKRKVKTIQGGARFAHYLIDIFIYFGIEFLVAWIGLYDSFLGGYRSQTAEFSINFMGYGIFLAYYVGFEALFGATPGKLLFGRTVIDEYANKPNILNLLGRNVIRLVPFEAFSCLGERGWHDKWSNTYVVSKEELNFLKQQLGESPNDYEDELLDT